jgi:hypothetical protein
VRELVFSRCGGGGSSSSKQQQQQQRHWCSSESYIEQFLKPKICFKIPL